MRLFIIMHVFLFIFIIFPCSIYSCGYGMHNGCKILPKIHLRADKDFYHTGILGTGLICDFLGGNYLLDLEKKSYDSKYQDIWEGGLRWLSRQAIPEITGCKWPLSVQESTLIAFIDNAYIHNVFLRGWKSTNRQDYYDSYVKGKKWFISQAVSDKPAGYAWPYIEGEKFAFVAVTEYGVSGIGAFLLSMYKNTNDKEAEKYAKGAAEWLKAIALSVDSKEKPCYKWRAGHGDIPKDAWTRARYFHTGWCWGAAGVCWFLYKMYEEFGDSSYLEYANGGMNWLKSIAIPEAGGYKWYRSDYEEDINQYHTTWGKGAAGIGYVFLLGYQITGDPSYLEYAKKAGEWLTSQAIPSGNGGYKWPSDKPYFPNTWCDGSCIPVALFFAELYKEIRIERYLEYVMGAYNWINTIKVTGSSGGYTWYINEELNNLGDISENGGTASMIRHIGRICNQPTLEEFADKAAIWIINQKEVDGDGYKWIKRVEIKQVKIDEIFSKTPILLKSYPNPFINSCQISAFSGQVSAFSLQIYDIKGKLVRELKAESEKLNASWDGRDNLGKKVPGGSYFYWIKINGKKEKRIMSRILKLN